MSDYVQTHIQVSSFKSDDTWSILNEIELSIKQKVEKAGIPLKNWDVEMYRGVLTGFNDAFIITSDKREEILSNCADDSERDRTAELIRPILRGRDIRRYGYEWADLWLINTHNGVKDSLERIKVVIATIEATVYEIWRLKQKVREANAKGEQPPAYLRKTIRRLDRQLNQMRSVAVYYKEYSSIENLQLLGENYIKQMKRDLTPKTFQTSILCQRLGIAKDGFYSSMKEMHKYNASDFDYLDSLGWDYNPSALDSRADKDVNPDAPICIGMDYNANINWIVAGQPTGKRLNVIKSIYTKFERKIPALIEDFCRYYMNHRNKTVIYYYDTTALGSNYAVNTQDFHWVVCHEFERYGWAVESVYMGNPMRHDEKYLLINQGFAGKQRLMPFFNRQNNDDLILAIQTAGVTRGRNGFRKDKGGEKLAETEEDLLQHRTDGTDAFDTLYIGCEKFPKTTVSYNFSGVL